MAIPKGSSLETFWWLDYLHKRQQEKRHIITGYLCSFGSWEKHHLQVISWKHFKKFPRHLFSFLRHYQSVTNIQQRNTQCRHAAINRILTETSTSQWNFMSLSACISSSSKACKSDLLMVTQHHIIHNWYKRPHETNTWCIMFCQINDTNKLSYMYQN